MRPPDLIIGNPPQTLRWHLPKIFGWRLNLHKWLKSDDDRALHDHRGDSFSIILWGGYYEITFNPECDPTKGNLGAPRSYHKRWYGPGSIIFRKAETPHRIELKPGTVVWSLWIRAPFRRTWGFWCPKGWRSYEDYISDKNYDKPGSTSTIGRGCD